MPMNALVATSEYRSPEYRDGEALSPELVLVDPFLAASARQRLPDIADSLSPTTSASVYRSTAGNEALTALATAALEAADHPISPSKEERSRSWRVPLGLAAATVAGLLLLDVHVQVGRTPASAEPAAISKPPDQSSSKQGVRQRGTQQRPAGDGRRQGQEAPKARRFAWAPAVGASGYHIELFRGQARVYSGEATEPQITIPARWSSGGRRRSLAPGEYRWYVWPIVSGRRAFPAIVQAQLVVPST
jgi:hypothetical protein